MIISISGAQGQGKSTILSSVKELGYDVIENKTARSILSDWGMTLDQVYLDKPLCVKFHDEILNRHDTYCAPFYDSKSISFIERSFADIFSYALAVLGPHNQYSNWLNEFYDQCLEKQTKMSGVMYLSGRIYTPEEDGVRSVNKHFMENIDNSIKKYLKEFSTVSGSHMVYDVNYADHKCRMAIIKSILERYYDV
jgi:hypothetical protein